MKKRLSGQITIEVSIVFPIIMMVVASLIYFSFYVHDVITIKSYVYSAGIENASEDLEKFDKAVKEKVEHTPVFVLDTVVSCLEKSTYYEITINSDSKSGIKWLEKLIGEKRTNQSIKIEKKMSVEILYGCRAAYDQLIEGKVK